MTHLSLFSGIGGIDLAAEWAGFKTVAFVEKDPFCRQVLAKHWPGVPIYDDVQWLDATEFRGVDLVSGGFPCQDVSQAGAKAGMGGLRTVLYRDLLRVVRSVEPRVVLLENVTGLLTRGMGAVIGDLATMGFDAEWFVLSAVAAGAPHERNRVFIVAYPQGNGWFKGDNGLGETAEQAHGHKECSALWRRGTPIYLDSLGRTYVGVARTPRDDDGFPNGVDRLRALGNAVVPAQVFPILRAIADQIQGVSA